MKKTNNNKKIKIFVAMSGGVDSSVAALLLQKQGYDLAGAYIKGWYPPGVVCNWKEDRRDAMRVCAKLGIPFITIDAEKEYKKEVVDYMISEYKEGRTPNPDVMCNKSIKFGVFLQKALAMGADYIATGHYVRSSRKNFVSPTHFARPATRSLVLAKSSRKNGNHADLAVDVSETEVFSLSQAKDQNKDQSYFLWTLTQDQLKYCLFPLGDLLKPEVREIAQKNDLATAQKEESQGVCFIGEFDMENFLKKYIKPKKGKVMAADGKTIGEHNGLAFYTIGQRHGFFGGGKGGPYYAVEKDFKNNILVVAEKEAEKKFGKKEIEIKSANWISRPPEKGNKYWARIRYRQPLEECKIVEISPTSAKVIFSKPQRAVTPGQSAVVYDGDEMIGGGVIK